MAMEHIWNGILEFYTTLWSSGGPYLWIIGLFTFVFVVAAFLYPIDLYMRVRDDIERLQRERGVKPPRFFKRKKAYRKDKISLCCNCRFWTLNDGRLATAKAGVTNARCRRALRR
jgi:hypothetical protein